MSVSDVATDPPRRIVSSSAQDVVGILVGAVLIVGGSALYLGKAKVIRRLPVLSDAQQGVLLAAFGAVLAAWHLVALI
jgi:hypothetical protein